MGIVSSAKSAIAIVNVVAPKVSIPDGDSFLREARNASSARAMSVSFNPRWG